LVARATSLEGRKTNLRLIIYSHSSTNPKNLEKIGPVDFEINGLKKSFKIFKKKNNKKQQNV